jgi:tRNA threonylcarbamoyl adenosine modification protein YeaZ
MLIQSMPVILAIETSQRIGGVALRDLSDGAAGEVHVEMLRAGAAGGRHDDDLLPAIDRLFSGLGLKPRDLPGGAVAVSIGPGGFTGLRIAVSTAKMLAEVLAAKLIAVPSALVAAQSIFPTPQVSGVRFQASGADAPAAAIVNRHSSLVNRHETIIVALACKGETCWCTRLARQSDGWSIMGQPGLVDARSLDLQNVEAILGDAHLPPAIRQVCADQGVDVIEPVFDPRACLTAAQTMMQRREFTDPLTLAPLYPRQPEAVSLWQKRHSGS